jgi:hypothetical protein
MQLKHLLGLVCAAAVIAGCGGGGSGGSNGSLDLFATDSPRDDYSKIWITLHKVELIDASGATTIFNDTNGTLLDLRTLRDASGERFVFLGKSGLALKAYNSARLTVAKALSAVATGSSVIQALTFHNNYDAGPGMSALTFNIVNGSELGSSARQFVIDFDLAQWVVNAGVVTPYAGPSSGVGLDDPLRHENEDYHGTISGLTGAVPNQSFTLTTLGGTKFLVHTSTTTLIFNNNGAMSPALANGQFIEVRGTFSTLEGALNATSIKIEDGAPGVGEPEVKGPFSNVNPKAGTFQVEALEVENFVPANTLINVTTSIATVFRNDRGVSVTQAEFFALLEGGLFPFVEVEGNYDSGSNTLAALKVKLEDDIDGGANDDAEVNGVVSLLNVPAGSFSVTLGSWAGFNGAPGMVVPVQTDGSTTYRNDNGDPITAEVFFGALANGLLVEAEGHFSSGVLIAKEAKLDND